MNGHGEYRPVIVSYEALTALGDMDATWKGLMACQSGLRAMEFPNIPAAYPCGSIPGLDGPYGSARRLTNLLEMGLDSFPCRLPESGDFDIMVASTKGAADELLGQSEEPAGQPWDISRMIARRTGCRGRQQTISAACASGTVALIQAARHIRYGQSVFVLVAGIDLLSSFVMAGFDVLKALSPTPCTPFDRDRAGLSLGEGLGLIALCREEYAVTNQLEVLARIEGWGISCDATHITAPSRDGRGLIRVIREVTGKGSTAVGAINAHGTGTVYNDAMELTAFSTCWGDMPPFHSVKGAIGHCLGAAGVIESAISLRSLKEGCIPPTVGYRDGDVPAGKISGTRALPLDLKNILVCNSGFGGINAGINLSGP